MGVTPRAATWSEGAFELPLAFALMYREQGIASSGEYLIEENCQTHIEAGVPVIKKKRRFELR